MDDGAWKRVAEKVRTRREEELGLTQEQVAAKAEVGTATIRLIESAGREKYNRSTLRSVSQGLGWTPDSIDRIFRGDEPIEAEPEAATDEELALLRRELEALKSKVDRLEQGQRQGN